MAILEEVKPHYGRLGAYINGEWNFDQAREISVDKNPAKDQEIAQVEVLKEEEVEQVISS
jgi:acyl-CoA reductase-like NAD-dependent aldehyde dehydrogenase